MYALIFNLIPVVGALIIGSVMAPKAGPAKGKMWLGLGLVIASSVVSLIWQLLLSTSWLHSVILDGSGMAGFGVMNAAIGLAGTALLLIGLYFLCAAVVMGRSGTAYLDPSRPGAPPASGYQGPGANPYV